MIVIIKIKLPFGEEYDALLYQYRDVIGMYYDASNRIISIPVSIDNSIIDINRIILDIMQIGGGEVLTLGGMDPFSLGMLDISNISHIIVGCSLQAYLKCATTTLNISVLS